MQRLLTVSEARRMKPIMRIVHGKLYRKCEPGSWYKDRDMGVTYPTCWMRLRTAMGKMVPPMLEPKAIRPSAIPFLLENQCGMTPSVGPKMTPQPSWEEAEELVGGSGKDDRGTHPYGEALAEQELPVGFAFCDEERRHNEPCGCYPQRPVEVSHVEHATGDQARNEHKRILY